MKEHLKDYTAHLEEVIGEYMNHPVTERSAEAVKGMTECWEHLKAAEKMLAAGGYDHMITHDDTKMWANKMVNDDGTTGAHWTMEQTTAAAKDADVKFEHITDWCWWITMNMMYSDYCKVADKYGVDTASFYADMAKAFLFDKDGGKPEHKLGAYYHGIVDKEY